MALDKSYLLSDEDLRNFIVNGYVTVKADLPASFHETIYQKTRAVFEKEGNPGNNLLPKIPEIQEVFAHPNIQGALVSILGENYLMHSHRHPHFNPPLSGGQNLHKDSYWGYQKIRYHRPWWVMVFYYPQDVTVADENGPSAVLPGSQYYNTRLNDNSEVELPIFGEAGTATIIHFDLWHRAMPNRSDRPRYMMKFQFVRLEEPESPTWNAQDSRNSRNSRWQPIEIENRPSSYDHNLIWSGIWDWLNGKKGEGASINGELGELGELDKLAEGLYHDLEPVRLNSAYALGSLGKPGISALIGALRARANGNEAEPIRLASAYGLSAAGESAVPELIEALNHESEAVRRNAAYALAQMGRVAGDAVMALVKALKDEADSVRRCAAEALGTIGRSAERAVQNSVFALMETLHDKDKLTRFNAALSLTQLGQVAKEAVPELIKALKDEDRYVRAAAVDALSRIETDEAKEALLGFLFTSRWCSSTSRESTF